jgi:hypothetical protein
MQEKLITKERSSFTELLEQREAIILDLENLHYYTLNGAAIFLWKQLCSGAAQTAAQLSGNLAAAFGLNAEQAETDTLSFLAHLRGNGLVRLGECAADEPAKPAHFVGATGLPTYEPPQLKLSNSLTQVVLSGSSTIATAAIATGG